MRHRFVILVLVLVLPGGAAAAQGCGDDALIPCGPCVWCSGRFRPLQSPTPFETPSYFLDLPVPTEIPTSTPTLTPSPSPTGVLETAIPGLVGTPGADAGNMISTLQPLLNVEIETTPGAGVSDGAAELGRYVGDLWGYFWGLEDVGLGQLAPFIQFGIFALGFAIAVYMLTTVLPFLLVVGSWIQRVLALVGNFLPFT